MPYYVVYETETGRIVGRFASTDPAQIAAYEHQDFKGKVALLQISDLEAGSLIETTKRVNPETRQLEDQVKNGEG